MPTPYTPTKLPLAETLLDYNRLVKQMEEANIALSFYNGLLYGLPNARLMLGPLTLEEAVLSSKIEGTQATVNDVMQYNAGMMKEGENKKDIQEINNYREALGKGTEQLKDYPIRISFIRELHRTLMTSVRGQDKKPGEIRNTQNWIGAFGSTIEQASFIPPDPLQLPQYLEDWEAYLEYKDKNFLVQTALVHAQFELLHPFDDGNGRMGRILIPLFLYHKKVLSEPMFYLSEYLEGHRDEYYERLRAISAHNDWQNWVEFFLRAVIEQANKNSKRVREIKQLYDEMKTKIQSATRSQYTIHLLDAIFSIPLFSLSDMTNILEKENKIKERTSRQLLLKLEEKGILEVQKKGSGSNSRVLYLPELMDLIDPKRKS